ncbi:aldehyde dehydrogenase family protein [Variovorax ginsengisoli]|uniref:Aldehyde dehydrogenase family protein n=1 Tax=Variovorax ginsengisoli TaxID=363844 RepID=A0ABT8RXE8_9BURK|nr:aldehyde dehydrogenase family protein [Variovorax ginsengisoli]MDN8611988.1 aldehyde dehydrogenase family protein [Variovorax ginsengisoli]MDO1531158.1 aldehyde dehydrogenase family protein [Variovorax ginsengisoli]
MPFTTDLPPLNYIDGQWVRPASTAAIEMICPSDGHVIGQIARGGAEDIDAAVAAARRAFEGEWGRTTATERGRLLSRLGLAILANQEELAQLEANDTGKPLKLARSDVIATARYFEYYGGAADKLHGDTIPFLDGYQVMIVREPRGVTGHIIPWNYPAQMFGRTLGAALATGNATVLKPAEEACLSIVRLTQLAAEVGIPAGAINLVTGYGEEAGAALASHAGIDFLSFTGSPEVGTLIQKSAADNHVPCVLELGGKSPQLVFEDADLDKALPVVINAIIQNAGQTCSAGSRVLVQRSIYEKVVSALAARMNAVRVGPHEADLDCGPLISKVQHGRVMGFLERARKDGIPVIGEGRIDERASKNGFFVKPTLLGPVPLSHELAFEEVFGPVLVVIPFDDESDAVRIANGTEYGLIAGVWSENGARQIRVAKKLRVGQVYVNGYGAGGGIELPFGGFKRSGHGREKGFEALREYTVAKTIVLNHG